MSNREAVKRYRERNLEKCRKLRRDWYQTNKQYMSKYFKRKNLEKRGFTLSTYEVVKAYQNEACAICRTLFSGMDAKKIHADHCHETNDARGVLCHYCNVGLGVFTDSVEKLQAAIDYLTKPTMKEVKMLEPKIEDLASAIIENTAVLRELIALLASGKALPAVDTVAAETPVVDEAEVSKAKGPAKKAKPAAAEVAETPKVEQAATPEPKEDDAPAADEDAPEVTYQDAAQAITALSKSKGRDVCVALLKKFGASKLPEVKPEDFAAIVAEAKAAL